MKTWVKLYTEINRDPKFGSLTWAQKGLWSALLALAGELDDRDEYDRETGALDTVEAVAWHLRCSVEELADAVAAFRKRGMVEVRDGIILLIHYAERQARPPSSSRDAVAERVAQHRARQPRPTEPRNDDGPVSDESCNEDVTSLHDECNESVARVKQAVTPSDKIRIDTDSDSERALRARIESDSDAARVRGSPNPSSQPTYDPKDLLWAFDGDTRIGYLRSSRKIVLVEPIPKATAPPGMARPDGLNRSTEGGNGDKPG